MWVYDFVDGPCTCMDVIQVVCICCYDLQVRILILFVIVLIQSPYLLQSIMYLENMLCYGMQVTNKAIDKGTGTRETHIHA